MTYLHHKNVTNIEVLVITTGLLNDRFDLLNAPGVTAGITKPGCFFSKNDFSSTAGR